MALLLPEKVTDMVLKVNLNCPCCYKKVKKVLAKFPQVANQVFNEKEDTVNITVVTTSPEMIRDKIAKKGGKTVKNIQIKEPPKSKPKEQPKTTSDNNKPKGDDKPKTGDATKAEKPKQVPVLVPVPVAVPAPTPVQAPIPAPTPVQAPIPAPALPLMVQAPVGYPYYMPASGEYNSGPAESSYNQTGYWKPVPVSDNYGYYGYGEGSTAYKEGYNANYFNEENPSACAIM